MTTVEVIQQKLPHLPSRGQEEVIEAVEGIERRYRSGDADGEPARRHVLELLAEISVDGPPDLSSNHHRLRFQP